MPSCSQTGTPRHFTVSITSGSALWMMLRSCASVLPRQSSSAAIFASICCAASSDAAVEVEIGLLRELARGMTGS
ncbi:hypothetical protein D9M71_780120 [compost metagenome]